MLRCAGEIDFLNAHELATTVADGLAQIADTASELSTAPQVLVVDLREVSFFSASAVTALVQSGDESLGGRGALRLIVGETRPVRLVVDALDLRDTFSLYDDLAAALDQPRRP